RSPIPPPPGNRVCRHRTLWLPPGWVCEPRHGGRVNRQMAMRCSLGAVRNRPWRFPCSAEVLLAQAGLALTCSQTLEITTDPSPTAEATRLTEPARTSPTAKMPGCEVANGEACGPPPVMTNPLSSSFTKPDNHSVFGAAPTMMNSARAETL